MAPKSEDPVTPFFDMVGMAMSGDPVMLRGLVATLGAFSIRLLVALLILGVTLWLAGRLGKLAERALGRLPHQVAVERADVRPKKPVSPTRATPQSRRKPQSSRKNVGAGTRRAS